MSDEQKCREAFEAWLRNRGTPAVLQHPQTEDAWNAAWNARIPPGYRLVPDVATDEMLDEGRQAIADMHKTGAYCECPGVGWSESCACWAAMLAAATEVTK
jgi:hypothetical protein